MAKKLLITVIVLSAFQDKFDHKTQYPAGTELQVDEERAEDLVSRGLAKVKEKKAAEEADKAEKPEVKDAVAPPAGDNPETSTEDDGKRTEE